MTEELTQDHEVPEDDAVIGQAFRLSLIVFAVIGLVGFVLWRLLGGEPELPEAGVASVEAPRVFTDVVEAPVVHFTDVTAAAGIRFARENGATGDKYLPETMGGGVAFLDYDVDGDADLFFLNGNSWSDPAGGPPQALYANDGTGAFTDVTAAAGLDFPMQGMGIAVGDWDADGDPDLYLSGVGEHKLLRNDRGVFQDVTEAAGLGASGDAWGSSCAFFDADGDEDLDLFVCRYVLWSPEIDREVGYQLTGVGRAYGPPMNYAGAHSRLFRNEGDGRFADVSAAAGIEVVNEATDVPTGKALGIAPCDVDGDDDLDLIVANDTVRNFLFVSDGKGSYEEKGAALGVAYGRNGEATGAMGIDTSYYRGDGSLGFAVGNFANEMSSLYVTPAGRVYFTDESIVEGIGAPSRKFLSFGVFFFDYDLDGREDFLQVNGHLEDEISTVQPSQSFEQPPQLFWNAGPEARAAFVEVPEDGAGDLLTRHIVGRGCAYADIDADGDLDVVLTQSVGPPRLLRNDLDSGAHWLRVRLEDAGGNTAGIGARITVQAGGRTQRRVIMPTRGYLSQVQPLAHFGLGETSTIDTVTVRWPDGQEQVIATPPADRELVVTRP